MDRSRASGVAAQREQQQDHPKRREPGYVEALQGGGPYCSDIYLLRAQILSKLYQVVTRPVNPFRGVCELFGVSRVRSRPELWAMIARA